MLEQNPSGLMEHIPNHLPNGARHVQRLEDGTIEVTDTLSKQDYYRSLRRDFDPRWDCGVPTSPSSLIGLDTPQSGTLKQVFGSKKSSVVDYKPSGKEETCGILMLEGVEKTFTIDRNAFGIHIFEKVCKEMDLRETEYFGMTYRSSPRVDTWLKMDKRLSKQLEKQPWKLEFHVRYYPPNMDEFKDDLTRYRFCLQLRQDIISGLLLCSFQTYVMLGAYAVQSEAGDYDPETHADGVEYIANMPFAPPSLQSPNMLQRIAELHRLHKGQTPVQADRGFLENARRHALYGIEFHKVTAASGESVAIGISHRGLLVYRGRLKIAQFEWLQLVKLMYKSKRFTITARALNVDSVIQPAPPLRSTTVSRWKSAGQDGEDLKEARSLSFQCVDPRAAKRLWESCTSQHAFFRLRNQPGTQRPNLTTAFNTRKYHYSDRKLEGGSRSSSLEWNQQAQPQIQRVPTRRKPAYYGSDDGGPANGLAPIVVNNDPDQFYILPGSPPLVPAESINPELMNRLQPPAYRQPGSTRAHLAQEFWQMSAADCTQGLGMNTDGTDVAALQGSGWQGCRANRGIVSPGAYFYEVSMMEEGQLRLGWATNDASLVLGSDKRGVAYGTTGDPSSTSGKLIHNNIKQAFAANVVPGDVIGCYLELLPNEPEGENIRVKWSYNGQIMEPPNPSIPLKSCPEDAIFPVASLKDARVCINFGYKPFKFPPIEVSSSGLPWVPVAYISEQDRVGNSNVGWRINPGDMTSTNNLVISPNGRMVQSVAGTGWQGFRANKGIHTGGKYYYEVGVVEDCGLARVGWSFGRANLDLGLDIYGYGFGADRDGFGNSGRQGKKLHADVIENYGEAFGKNDIIGSFIDLDYGFVQWSKNGKIFGPAYYFNPLVVKQGEPIYPATCLVDTTLQLNYGDLPYKFPPDGDWIPLFAAPDEVVFDSPSWPKHSTVERKESHLVVQNRQIEHPLDRPQPPARTSSHKPSTSPDGGGSYFFNSTTLHGMNNGVPHAEASPVDSPQEDEVYDTSKTLNGFGSSNEDDWALDQAILATTKLNQDNAVLTDSLGVLRTSNKHEI